MASPRKNPHAVALGKKGGAKRSDAKTKAARENGKKGGAPRKECNVCGHPPSAHPVKIGDGGVCRTYHA